MANVLDRRRFGIFLRSIDVTLVTKSSKNHLNLFGFCFPSIHLRRQTTRDRKNELEYRPLQYSYPTRPSSKYLTPLE